jgi:hypothetical protein
MDLPEDDGTPRAALDIAGQGVRAYNHRTLRRFEPDHDGWWYVGDAYDSLGELSYLAGALPQALQQTMSAIRAAAEAGHIGTDPGSRYDGDPAAAVGAASVALERAIVAAQQLSTAVADAQRAINAAHYAGPALDRA